MNPESPLPYRKSPRLKDYDYSQEGAYFVTICTQNRLHLFGDISGDTMELNPAGIMVSDWWEKLPSKFADIELDLTVVMPNHFHGIVIRNALAESTPNDAGQRVAARATPTLGTIVGSFKSKSINDTIAHIKENRLDIDRKSVV